MSFDYESPFNGSNTHPPIPSNFSMCVWNFQRVGRCVMVSSVMPMFLAVS